MKKPLLIFSLLFAVFAGLSAQSNEVIDSILDQQFVSFGNAVYLVLAAAQIINEDSSIQNAVGKLAEFGWDLPVKQIDDTVTAEEFAELVMRGLGLKGGLMYSLFPVKRYAYREMVFKKYLSSEGGRARPVQGDEALRVIGLINRTEWEGDN